MEALNIKTLLASATMVKPTAKKKPIASTFDVREGTFAICQKVTGDVVAAVLFHAVLELWIETKKKVKRSVDGEVHGYLFLTGEQLQTLSGLTHKQLVGNALPKLKSCSFIEIERRRLTPDLPNMRRIRIDHAAFWFEVAHILDPTKEVKTKEQGVEWAKKVVDRHRLPHLFKRLFDLVENEE